MIASIMFQVVFGFATHIAINKIFYPNPTAYQLRTRITVVAVLAIILVPTLWNHIALFILGDLLATLFVTIPALQNKLNEEVNE